MGDMCDLDAGFKLCTCDPETLERADWELQRHDPGLPPERRRGRAARPRFTASDQERIERVLTALESGQAFDTPEPSVAGDVLVLFGHAEGGGDLRFRFDGSRWEADRSTSLTSWRPQMRPHRAGTIDG